MDINPKIFTAKVMHKRLAPKVNNFTYGVYYLMIPLPCKKALGFYPKDLGFRDGSNPEKWAREILSKYNLSDKTKNIILITMPKVLGYIFNPVSFYLCFNSKKKLHCVISEVHNTFGEQHSYICAHSNHSEIKKDDWLTAEKMFHVSPFLPREGSYKFRFDIDEKKLGIWIDYYDKHTNKQLVTSLIGSTSPLNKRNLRIAFWKHPLVTIKAIILIHFQAFKLIAKGIKYLIKPKQNDQKATHTNGLNKYR